MTYQIRDLSATRKECTIDYPKAEMESHFQTKLKSLKNHIQLPGFRKGHASLAMIEKSRGAMIIQDLIDEKIQECWKDVCQKEAVLERPAISDIPVIKNLQQLKAMESDLKITLSFDVAPKFDLIPMDKVAEQLNIAFVHPQPVTQEKQDSYRKVLALECSVAQTVDRPAARGDKLLLSVEYTETGEVEKDLELILDPTQTQEEFISKVEGLSAEQSRSFEYTPEFSSKNKDSDPSKPVAVKVTVHAVQELKEPSLSDLCRYVQDLKNVAPADQEAKLSAWIQETITALESQTAYRQNEQLLRDALLAHYQFELPSVHTRDMTFENEAKKESTLNAVKLNYILGRYSESVTLRPTADEIDFFAKIFSQDLGLPLQYMAQLLQSNKHLQKRFEETVTERALLKRIMEACGFHLVLASNHAHDQLIAHDDHVHSAECAHDHQHSEGCSHHHHD